MGNDQKVIQHALNQGGREAAYILIHVVESAAARYLGQDTLDHETQQGKDNLKQYQDQLAACSDFLL